ncbi:hypothetical protein GGU11DRAFT_760658 [Lentinula aff. detonsa]|nr:hypothetical protein GGU11DRAFT_760658 [Lentinula aff. detonsa]
MSPTPSRPNSPSDDEERAEELRLQKKREECEKREAERRAEEEEEAAAEARLAEIPEKKRKEEEEKKKQEEEEEQERKKKEIERVVKEKKEKEEREKEKREEENRAKSVGALVQASIARRGKRNLPIDVDAVKIIGKKRKRVAMIASNNDFEGNEPNSGEDGEDSEPESDEYEDKKEEDEEKSQKTPTPTPTPTPGNSSKCDRCTSKGSSCTFIRNGSASCIACRKAKVKCSLVGNERTVRRSKRLRREESPVASSSHKRIEVLEERNRELAHRLFLLEDMVRFIVQTIWPVDANEELEEDRVKRTGDVKGKG